MINVVIYDMDGIIIDSEPLWRKAEMKVFAEFSVPLTEDMCKETMGLRVDEVVEYWSHRYPLNMSDFSVIEERIMDEVVSLVESEGEILPGVTESLVFFSNKGMIIALASSSQMRLINAVVDRFNLRGYFSVIHSAEVEEYGKPHPGVYISTAKKLQVKPSQCLAVEDSINGILSAKAAKMKCISVPNNEHRTDKRLGISDVVVDSLNEIDESLWKRVNS